MIAAKFGAITFLIVGLGVFIVKTFQLLLGDDTDGVIFSGGDEAMFQASMITAESLFVVSVFLAVGLGIYFNSRTDFGEVLKPTVIAVAAGAAIVGILMVFFGVIFEPDFADVGFGDEIAGFLGYLLGSVIIAGLVGFLIENDPLELLEE